jgi:hypothetical protein
MHGFAPCRIGRQHSSDSAIVHERKVRNGDFLGGRGGSTLNVVRWYGGRPRLIALVELCNVGDGLDRTTRRRLRGGKVHEQYKISK